MSTQFSKLALVLLCVIFVLSSCEKDLSVQKAVHITEWSVDEFEPFDWNARFQELSKPSSIKSGNSDQPFKSPNPAELKRVYDFIDRPEHTLVIDKITEEIGTPDWDMTSKIKHHGNEYMLYTPLMTPSGEVNGLFQYHSDKSTNRQSFRAVRESSISSLVENNDSPLLGLVDVISFMNTTGVVTEKVEDPINEWVIEQKPEDLKKEDSNKNVSEAIRVWYYYPTAGGAGIVAGSYIVTINYPCSNENTGGGSSDPFENDIDETIDGGNITIPTLELEQIESELDQYPCAQAIVDKIKSGIFNSNSIAKAINDIFGTNDEVNIKISAGQMGWTEDGRTESQYNPNSTDLAVSVFITLNEDYLDTTEDHILSTVFHEMIHGYVDYFRSAVAHGEITQAQFDSRFPLWTNNPADLGHDNMAFNYVNVIKDILLQNNPSLEDDELEALSIVGLTGSHWVTENYTTSELNALNSIALRAKGLSVSANDNDHFVNCN